MKKILFIAALLAPFITVAQKKTPKSYDLIVGSYTKGTAQGISVYRFYTESGRLAYLSQVPTSNPSYLCVSANNKFVYAVNEDGKDGGVTSFSFEPKNGILTQINKQPSQGADPCYISVDKDMRHAFVANYSSGNLTVLPINKDGSLGAVVQNLQDAGTGPKTDRQEGPHVHTAFLSPDEKYLLYSDLGTDKINHTRHRSPEAQPLTPLPEDLTTLAPGSGPRHLDFTPDHKYVYVIAELSASVTAYEYHGGKMKQIQNITMLPAGFNGTSGAADIHVSADGKFVYASNRGTANDIVVYAIDPNSGKLTYVDRAYVMGTGPRNFVIDPTGRFLLVANQTSDNIVVFKRDVNTGRISNTGIQTKVGNPVCLKFAPVE
ncbi:lactonase family protein [Mucilaginibacter ginkgonis]|uniref:Lactonase family protein n=1 Tax=Mucilaginibacter ginkgonis TaxID=2682091 RepID=A0A6I4I0G9_9SPHI|nr:lactonase family protein [Mucilaginibacter ginkgonis]QQL48960.1 lactonase family protein [Mucilaginibacter ginkgonis]